MIGIQIISVIEYILPRHNRLNNSDKSIFYYIVKNNPITFLITRAIESEHFLTNDDYNRILPNHTNLNENVLEHSRLCIQSVVKKFNKQVLYNLYKLSRVS